MARRLPVYLVIDTSGSMTGEPIAAVETFVQTLVSALRQDPFLLETAYLSIITFDSSAKQIVPLTELTAFQIPSFSANGIMNSLGDALEMLVNKIDTEVVKATAEVKGDWKPVVFIMTNGTPTDDWQKGLAEFRRRKTERVVACAASQAADTNVLKQITECVVQFDSSTIKTTIKTIFLWDDSDPWDESDPEEVVGIGELLPPPPEVNIVI